VNNVERVEARWYGPYLHNAFNTFANVVIEGADEINIVHVEPSIEFFTALQADLETAFDEKKHPFFYDGQGPTIEFSKINFQQTPIECLAACSVCRVPPCVDDLHGGTLYSETGGVCIFQNTALFVCCQCVSVYGLRALLFFGRGDPFFSWYSPGEVYSTQLFIKPLYCDKGNGSTNACVWETTLASV